MLKTYCCYLLQCNGIVEPFTMSINCKLKIRTVCVDLRNQNKFACAFCWRRVNIKCFDLFLYLIREYSYHFVRRPLILVEPSAGLVRIANCSLFVVLCFLFSIRCRWFPFSVSRKINHIIFTCKNIGTRCNRTAFWPLNLSLKV